MSETNFNTLVLWWIALGGIVFIINLKIVAPYGRHASKKWGVLINNRLAWIIMESPVFFLVLYFVLSNLSALDPVVKVLSLLFCLHYFNRTFIFPFRIKEKSNKMPIGVMLLAVIFNLFNGFFIGYSLGNFSSYTTHWFTSLPFIFGSILFVIGLFINWRADSMLIGLRKDGSTGYKIPYGFLFDRISCPNHFGEMLEWSGYALMSFNLPALSFAIWTAANLIPRAIAHHKWYKSHFDDYPKDRKAFLPGLW